MTDATPTTTPAPALAPDATDALANRIVDIHDTSDSAEEVAQRIAPLLGAHPQDDGSVAFAFWLPQVVREQVADADILLELLDPVGDLELATARTTAAFRRTTVPMRRHDAVTAAVVDGVSAGTRDRVGTFYAVRYRARDGEWHRALDPMAASVPYGAFAPAEVVDLAAAQADRADVGYWRDLAATAPGGAAPDRLGEGIVKQGAAINILQLHVPTATEGGTLASLTRWFAHLADRVAADVALTPHEQSFLGYDAVQLLPVEPTTVYEAGPPFWQADLAADAGVDDHTEVTVELHRPDTTNWGYDVLIAGSAAVNPTLLETGRPHELIDLAEVLHTFPGKPIRLICDVVYGHADNQALGLLPTEWFAGPNMYGQDLAYRHPWVRHLLLEMQRRKVDFGFDAVRVDGAQDFRSYDAEAQQTVHDDAYLQAMSDVVQEVAGCRYRPWMIFEDGRPWPQPDWELSSTYRAVIDAQADDDVVQWGPLTFAHNTPFVYGFWLRQWWRIRQIVEQGQDWISGCANHDTLRRGTQVGADRYINERLGETKLQILDKAYDNPAITLLTYCALPGIPMDFINASMRAAWGFIRNTDDRYGVKVVAEESISLDWLVDEEFYNLSRNFPRLKAMGYEHLDQLQRVARILPALVEVTDYDLDAIARLLDQVDPPLAGPEQWDPSALKAFAGAWMSDLHAYANVGNWITRLQPQQTSFNLAVRAFRRARPWLRLDAGPDDVFTYLQPVDGHAVFVSLRRAPDGSEEVLLVANMEGGHADLVPEELPVEGVAGGGWSVALRTPEIGTDWVGGPITLTDSTGVVLTRSGTR